MNFEQEKRAEEAARQCLASYAHDAWSGWMKYLFSKGRENNDGTVTIQKLEVDRWKRQLDTKYKDLSEQEKQSDIAEADKMIAIMRGFGF